MKLFPVVTNTWIGIGRSHKRHFALKTQNHSEIFSMMHHVVMGDDPEVKKGKPAPDVFLAAARRFEVFVPSIVRLCSLFILDVCESHFLK